MKIGLRFLTAIGSALTALSTAPSYSMAASSITPPTYKFDPADTSCGGFPKLSVTTFPGSCLGLVVLNKGLRFPRKILELEPHRFLITDMGGWDPINRGVLYELDLRAGAQQQKLIARAQGLLTPHDIQFGPDGEVYVGERGRITRWKKSELLNSSNPVKGELVLGDLFKGQEGKPNLHPLMKFAFGKTKDDFGDLYVNIGATTDACVKEAPRACTAAERVAQIRRYKYDARNARWEQQGTVWAKGLRNSMGLVTHSSGTLLQAENARDFATTEEPFDEMNVIRPGKNYGWPYCYDFAGASPEWKSMGCEKNYSMPYLLMPPHSAPLDILYYDGAMFPQLQGQLLMAWHGYQATGSRIVAFPTNEQGLPVLSETTEWSYNIWTADGPKAKAATPRGGNVRAAHYSELISVWDKRGTIRPAGAPVGMTVASDGAIFIIEDKNKSVLILTESKDPVYRDQPGHDAGDDARIQHDMQQMIATPELKATYTHLYQTIFQPVCAGCHSGMKGTPETNLKFLISERFVIPGNAESPLLQRVLSKDSSRRMPLGGSLTSEQTQQLYKWITTARPREQ